jgi:3-hydroxyacyl-CoA dehydrogenase
MTSERERRIIRAQIGKKPIRMKKEMNGHIANRIQAAVFREVHNSLDQDAASLADIDIAMAHGSGLRWRDRSAAHLAECRITRHPREGLFPLSPLAT